MSLAALQLDWLAPPARAARAIGWLALAACAAATVALVEHDTRVGDELERLRDRAEVLQGRLRPERARKPARAPDAQEARRIVRANAVIEQLTVPWDELFRAVEAADGRGMGLLSLVPNAQDHSLRLSGEARTVPDVLAYVDRIAAQPMLGQVHLLGFETVTRDTTPVVSFTLAAQWKPR